MKSRSANQIEHIVLIHCNLLRIMIYFQTSLTIFLSANSIQPNLIIALQVLRRVQQENICIAIEFYFQ